MNDYTIRDRLVIGFSWLDKRITGTRWVERRYARACYMRMMQRWGKEAEANGWLKNLLCLGNDGTWAAFEWKHRP